MSASAFAPQDNDSKKSTSKSRTTRIDFEEVLINLPPDGGWGWVVVISSFLCNCIIDGFLFSYGIFLEELSQSFNTIPSNIALVSSIMTGVSFFFGPFACALVNRYGFRIIGTLGGTLALGTFLATSFTSSLLCFEIILGFLGGIAFSLIYVPSIVILGFYFERWRALATSLAVCGSSIGVVVFPILTKNYLSQSSWKTKWRILSGLYGGCSLLALTYKPLPLIPVTESESKKVQFELNEIDSIGSFHIEKDKMEELKIEQLFNRTGDIAAFKTSSYKRFWGDSDFISGSIPPFTSSSSVAVKSILKSVSEIPSDKLSTVFEECDEKELDGKCCPVNLDCCKTESRTKNFYPNVSRPMYRDDVFYTGSLYTLPEYSRTFISGPSSRKSSLDYHVSVVKTPTQKDIREENSCKLCPVAVKRTLRTMLDMSLFRRLDFNLLMFSGLLAMVGLLCPYVFMPLRAKAVGVPEDLAFQLLSIIGVANTIGRLTSGAISSIPRTNALAISYISIFVCGVATACLVYIKSLFGHILYAIIFGFTIACYPALRSVLLVELFGLENLTNSFGIQMLFQGVGSFIGIPLMTVLNNTTGSYESSFIFSGACMIISALLLVPITWLKRLKTTKSKKLKETPGLDNGAEKEPKNQ